MRDRTFILIVVYVFIILIIKKNIKFISTYDMISIFLGAILFCIFNALKIIYLKKPFRFEELLLTAFVLFGAGFGKQLLLAKIYPKADKNKDGLVTTQEFYIWKDEIEKKLSTEE